MNRLERNLRKGGVGTERNEGCVEPVWIKIGTAAKLLDLTPGALRKRLARLPVPKGVVVRFGGTVLIHRDRFLVWVSSSPALSGPSEARMAG